MGQERERETKGWEVEKEGKSRGQEGRPQQQRPGCGQARNEGMGEAMETRHGQGGLSGVGGKKKGWEEKEEGGQPSRLRLDLTGLRARGGR